MRKYPKRERKRVGCVKPMERGGGEKDAPLSLAENAERRELGRRKKERFSSLGKRAGLNFYSIDQKRKGRLELDRRIRPC